MVAQQRKKSDKPLRDESPITEMEMVERPLSTKHQWPITREAEAIAKTVETGKAVRLSFRSLDEAKKVQMALRHFVAKKGLTMRYRKDAADRLVCWAEKMSSRAGEPTHDE